MKEAAPLWEVGAELSGTAMGRLPADLIIRDGRLVNVCTGEILAHTDVVIRHGRIALVGDAGGLLKTAKRVIDAGGRYLAPAFLDGHLHVESSMMTVCEYARAVIPHGTGAIFMDPHEIVNVLGLPGMRAMMRDGEASPLRVYVTTPSCVPAAAGLENAGATVTSDDIAETMGWDGVAGLGEMMDYNAILRGDPEAHRKVGNTLKAGRTATGHFPLSDTGAKLNAYLASGISCCHESVRPEEALAKMRLGAWAMIREGTAWDDLPAVIRAVTEHRVDTRFAVLVSDDLNAHSLLTDGHMDAIVRLAIRHGVNPVTAIQMATINPATCFGLAGDLGAVAPGRFADLNLLDDLADVKISMTVLGGQVVAENGALAEPIPEFRYPEEFQHTVHLPRPLAAEDFAVTAPPEGRQTRVIRLRAGSVVTSEERMALPARDGRLEALPERDVCKLAVFNRHHNPGQHSLGFAAGLGLRRGAVASTYAHDAHNLMIAGVCDDDMALAGNELRRCGGGMVAVADGRVLSLLELPVAGLLSVQRAPEVSAALARLADAWRALGSTLPDGFMTMSLLSLSVIPSLRLTDKGLVDVMAGRLVPLFV